MVRPTRIRGLSSGPLWWLVLVVLCGAVKSLRADELAEETELIPGRAIESCDVRARAASANDHPIADRIPVLAEPGDWNDVPGPHGERAVRWGGRRPGFRLLDRRGQELHVVPDVSLPRWSPDGRWLAVSHWSSGHPYQLALVNVRTGAVTPIPDVEQLEECAWSPDSRRLGFVGVSGTPGGSCSVGWLSLPDTSVHVVAGGLQFRVGCLELAWSADSRRFVALMHREYEHDDIVVTDLWLFGLEPGVCRLTATPEVEESQLSWLDDRRVIFRTDSANDGDAPGTATVLELPALARSRH